MRKEENDLPKVMQLVKVGAVTGGKVFIPTCYSFFYARDQETEIPEDRSNLSHFHKEHLTGTQPYSFLYLLTLAALALVEMRSCNKAHMAYKG